MPSEKKEEQNPDYEAPDKPGAPGNNASNLLFAIAIIVGIILLVSIAATAINTYTYGGAAITRDWSKYCTDTYPGSAYNSSTGTCEFPSRASPVEGYGAASSSSGVSPENATGFSGYGDDIAVFSMTGTGSRVFSMHHSGTDSFIVWLYDEKGNTVDLLVNEGGRYSGQKTENLTEGTYYLDITADGAWTVRINAA